MAAFDRNSGFVEIRGLEELVRSMRGMSQRLSIAGARAGARVGLHCVREAKANAPRSPTKAQHSKTLKRKRITARRMFFPGGLEKSITYEVLTNGDISVFVAKNSHAGAYARYIHDEKFVKWQKRGAGTVAKGQRADHKFIFRAVNDNVQRYKKVYEQEIDKELRRL